MDMERKKLIHTHLLPLLGKISVDQTEQITYALSRHIRLRHAVSGEYLEEPGHAYEGQCLLLTQSLAHSFQPVGGVEHYRMIGTMIWPRRSLIFHPDALLDDYPITEYTQILEAGPYLSIHYPVLRQLLGELSLLRHGIHVLSRHQARQRMQHDQLLHLPPYLRVGHFERQQSSFCKVATISQRAMHVSLSRQSYTRNRKGPTI